MTNRQRVIVLVGAIMLHLSCLLTIWFLASSGITKYDAFLFEFLSLHLRQLNIGASSILLTLCLTYWLLSRGEYAFLWLGLGQLTFVATSLSGLNDALPFDRPMPMVGIFMLPLTGMAVLVFSAYLTRARLHVGWFAAIAAALLLSFVLESNGTLTIAQSRLLIIMPVFELTLVAAVILLVISNARKLAWDQVMITASIAGIAIAAIIDTLTRINYLSAKPHLAPLAGHCALLSIAVHLMRRQYQLVSTTKQLIQEQGQALREQAILLQAEFKKTEQLIGQQASLEEQQRLADLLHSGVASNLSSIAALQSDQGLDASIGFSARHGLFEIRLLSDAGGDQIAVGSTLADYMADVMRVGSPSLCTDANHRTDVAATLPLRQMLELTRVVHEMTLTLCMKNTNTWQDYWISHDATGCAITLTAYGVGSHLTDIERPLQGVRIHAQSIGYRLKHEICQGNWIITLSPALNPQ